MSNYATKTELEYADLAARKGFIVLKAEVNKLDIDNLVNVPTSSNNLKTKLDDLDVGTLKTVPVDLKKLCDVGDNEFVKNTKFNTLKTTVLTNLDKKIPDATTLIHIDQYNTDKQDLEKKLGDVDKKIPDTSVLVTATVLNAKISVVENKIPDTSSSATATVLTTEIGDFKNKIPYHAKQITTQEFNKLTEENFVARLMQANLVSKTDFNNKPISLNRKLPQMKKNI